jgi:glyoxylase-like metal-dependent hydrolase (beta-lactamase superfamily II)
MILTSDELWAAATNCYVIAPERGGEAVIVDAPPDVDAIARLLARHDLVPVALLVTHGHVDHAGGAGGVVERTGVTAYVHPDDDYLTSDPVSQLRSIFGFVPPGAESFAPPEQMVDLTHGQRLELGGFEFRVRHTPGHTPGHCVFVLEEEGLVFSGDHLFAGSIGRTDLPGGDFNTLMASMRTEMMTLPDDMRVLPGHGPATTIGRERTTNPFLLQYLDA